ADFVLHHLRTADGRLSHSYKDGKAAGRAFLDDVACTANALLDVYQATFEARFFEAALALADQMIDRFADEQEGGFFFTPHDHEALVARMKDVHDNATPSGSGMA